MPDRQRGGLNIFLAGHRQIASSSPPCRGVGKNTCEVKRSKLGYVNIGTAWQHPIATPDPPMVQRHLKRMFGRSRCIDLANSRLSGPGNSERVVTSILLLSASH